MVLGDVTYSSCFEKPLVRYPPVMLAIMHLSITKRAICRMKFPDIQFCRLPSASWPAICICSWHVPIYCEVRAMTYRFHYYSIRTTDRALQCMISFRDLLLEGQGTREWARSRMVVSRWRYRSPHNLVRTSENKTGSNDRSLAAPAPAETRAVLINS